MRLTRLLDERERRNTLLLFLLAGLTTLSQGALELTLPLNLHHLGTSLPLVGTTVGFLGVGQIVSRLPAGHWYSRGSAPRLNSLFLAGHGLTAIGLALTPVWALQASLAALHGAAFGLITTFQLAMLIDSRERAGSMAPSMAWYTAAIALGYAGGSPLGAATIVRFGYPGAFAVSGGVALFAAALSLSVTPPRHHDTAPPAPVLGWRGLALGLAMLPAPIWLAALLGLYLNFITDSIASFFPIYAVAIGISLGFVGLLRSVNSLAGAAIRVVAAGVFRAARPQLVNHLCVVAMAAAAISVSLAAGPAALLATFAVLGTTRGLIRVTSATFVADERAALGRSVGLASGVYNAGLDAGAMLAPPLTGLLAAAAGIPGAFRIVGVGLPLAYYAAWFLLRSRRRAEPAQSAARS